MYTHDDTDKIREAFPEDALVPLQPAYFLSHFLRKPSREERIRAKIKDRIFWVRCKIASFIGPKEHQDFWY